ncbi:hypothetical protein, partial [Paenibacillus kobensis]|uniref:hypothetical protein n=1 Tax=Paenibacillus kobensis TaxID=59841 RepID=UPI0013E29EC4
TDSTFIIPGPKTTGNMQIDHFTMPYLHNMSDAMGWLGYMYEVKGGRFFETGWFGPNADGLMYRTVWDVDNDPQGYYVDEAVFGWLEWRAKTVNKTDEEKRFPIGKGWTWNIPYIKRSESGTFINLGSKGTYDLSLNGYPYKDISITYVYNYDTQQTETIATLLSGESYYFNQDGNLIKIT